MATRKERENHFSSFFMDEILSAIQCNILICHHFPVHIWAKHKQNTNLCVPLCCTGIYHAACIVHLKDIQERGKCVHLWSGGISLKWKCYNGSSTNLMFNVAELRIEICKISGIFLNYCIIKEPLNRTLNTISKRHLSYVQH